MSFDDLLIKRRKKYFSKLSRYAKYVFNDHFVLVLVFLLGALAYQYSELLKTWSDQLVIGKIVWIIALSFAVFFGKLLTLAEAADQVFLVVKEEEWQTYIKASKKRSMVLPTTFLLLLLGMAMPVLILAGRNGSMDYLLIAFSLMSLKWSHLTLEELAIRKEAGPKAAYLKKGLFMVTVVGLSLAFFWNSLVAALVSLGCAIGLHMWLSRSVFKNYPLIDWENLVHMEEKRLSKVNRLINLFTDVPLVKNKAKRRLYLDGLVKLMSGSNNTYQYLYARLFARGADYIGLYSRLAVIGMGILLFSSQIYMSLIINALVLFLIGFQLIPFYNELDQHILAQLYPKAVKEKRQAFKRILFYLLGLASVLFSLATLVGADWLIAIISIGTNLGFTAFFVFFYVDNRLGK